MASQLINLSDACMPYLQNMSCGVTRDNNNDRMTELIYTKCNNMNELPFTKLNDTDFHVLFKYDMTELASDTVFKPLEKHINDFQLQNEINSYKANYTIDGLNNKFWNCGHSNSFKIIHLNIQSLNAKLTEFQTFTSLFSVPIDVYVLSEIWDINLDFFCNILSGYDLYTDLPKYSKVGGVAAFVRRTHTVVVREDLKIPTSINSQVESVWLEVRNCNLKYIVGGVYRHPKASIPLFTETFEPVLTRLITADWKTPIIVAGDININLIKYDNSYTSRYLELLLMYNFIPVVLSPTRVTETSSTLIDHIYFQHWTH